jgi:hypothetical protein
VRTTQMMPGEFNASILSSIINSVCPQCGGSMMEFECQGRCRRNWLPEWEWAIRTARGSNSAGHQKLSGGLRR